MSEALNILKNIFGHPSFRDNQEEAIETVIDGQDVILLAGTGCGKSICYQIPAMVRDGVGIIISPLKALMKDQVDFLQFNGIAAETINSSITGYDRQNIMTAVRDNEVDLLYVTPEMLAQPHFITFLKDVDIAMFGIDEAHAASQWGHDFRPDYKALAMLPHHFPDVPRIAVTATADPQTLADIKETLGLHNAVVLESNLDRANISLNIEMRASGKDQQSKMLDIIRQRPGEAGLVYCVGKKTVDRVADWLVSEGISALPYHAGHSQDTREQNQDAFLEGDVDVLVCTVAFGMGVDKSDVRYVIHNDMPSSVEAYQQETGRAGRDGLPADAFMFVGNSDINIRKRMIKKSKAGAASKRTDNNKLDMVIALSETLYCRRHAIMNYFGKTIDTSCGNCDNCKRDLNGLDVSAEARAVCQWLCDNAGTEDTYSLTEKTKTICPESKHTKERWSSIVRQMIITGLIEVRHSDCGRLFATEKGKEFITEGNLIVPTKVTMTSAKFTKSAPAKATRSASATGTKPATRSPAKGFSLLADLVKMRNKIAKEERVPRYYVIHNATLEQMANERPITSDAMLAIKGIGEAKMTSYAHRFIPIIRQHAA